MKKTVSIDMDTHGMNDATGDRILEVALGGKRRNRLEALSKRVA